MKELLEKLVSLAERWRDLSFKYKGWDCQEYAAGKLNVRCYFADGGGHASVTFDIQTHSSFSLDKLEVSFHHVPKINDFTVRSFDAIGGAISRYRDFADKQELEFQNRDKDKVNADIEARKKSLKKELARLENGEVKNDKT